MSEATATRYVDLNETLRLFRGELKLAFPGVKFHVTRSRGTGYGYCSCKWTDGPTQADVEAIAGSYEGAGFDGRDDSTYTITHTIADGNGNPVTVKYATKSIHCRREISPVREAMALRVTLASWCDWESEAKAETFAGFTDEQLRERSYDLRARNGSQSLRSRAYDLLERREHAPASLLALNI